jgi:hypothetical protein
MGIERNMSPGKGGYTALSYINTLKESFMYYYQSGIIFQQDNAKIYIVERS